MSLANVPAAGKATAIETTEIDSNNAGYDAKFNQMHLDAHNKYRKMHKVGPMTIDPEMAKSAQAYA